MSILDQLGPAVTVMSGEPWYLCPECDGIGHLPTVTPLGFPDTTRCRWCLEIPTMRGYLIPLSRAYVWQLAREGVAS